MRAKNAKIYNGKHRGITTEEPHENGRKHREGT